MLRWQSTITQPHRRTNTNNDDNIRTPREQVGTNHSLVYLLLLNTSLSHPPTVCLSLTLLPLTVSANGNVLDWLSSLPFPGTTGAPSKSAYSNIRIGPAQVPPTVTKQFDPNNPPIPSQPGTPLSDSFHSTTVRRGIIAQKDFANGTEILKVAFEQMFNYSSPIAPGVSVTRR